MSRKLNIYRILARDPPADRTDMGFISAGKKHVDPLIQEMDSGPYLSSQQSPLNLSVILHLYPYPSIF